MLIKENKPERDSDGGADVGLDVIPTEFPLTIKNSALPNPPPPSAFTPTRTNCSYAHNADMQIC